MQSATQVLRLAVDMPAYDAMYLPDPPLSNHHSHGVLAAVGANAKPKRSRNMCDETHCSTALYHTHYFHCVLSKWWCSYKHTDPRIARLSRSVNYVLVQTANLLSETGACCQVFQDAMLGGYFSSIQHSHVAEGAVCWQHGGLTHHVALKDVAASHASELSNIMGDLGLSAGGSDGVKLPPMTKQVLEVAVALSKGRYGTAWHSGHTLTVSMP